ncbi:MAG: sugar ABC transporter permease [Chloroflexota bacterium]|nr:sugar ABC transporter permease [Anaerolineae bacterium]GIL09019.1 MAG: sugar ABC transporter permease [Chloroflexota bacterium]
MQAITPPQAGQRRGARGLRRLSRPAGAHLRYRWYVPYLFLLPGVSLYLLWMVYPLGYEFYISFFDWKIMPGQTSQYVGLENYRQVLHDKYFWLSLENTVRYTVVTVFGQMVIGLALAVLVHRVFIAKKLFRAIYYLPVVTSWVVVSFLFQFIFSSHPGGLANYALTELGLLSQPVAWMSETKTAWVIIYSLGIWKGIGWAMVIFLAALQGIPVELYEAASIDGAGEWGQFRRVTLPLIRRTTLFVLVALVIGGFQVFVSVYLITGGGPLHRTEVMLSYMYDRAFDRLWFGYGAAISYILAAIVVFISFVQMRLFSRPAEE